MELHHLRYFVALAEEGHFGRAAQRCAVSQPSLSQQVAQLEKQMRRVLINRLPSGATLTPAGELLLSRARVILNEVDEVSRQLREGDPADPQSPVELTVGAIPTMAPYLLPMAARRFVSQWPAARLTLHEALTAELVSRTVYGDLDLAVAAAPINDERLLRDDLASDALVLAVPTGHRLAGRQTVTPQEFADEGFVLLDEMHCLGEQIANYCRAQNPSVKVRCRAAQIATVLDLVSLGLGVSLVPAMAVTKSWPTMAPTPPTAKRANKTVGSKAHSTKRPTAPNETVPPPEPGADSLGYRLVSVGGDTPPARQVITLRHRLRWHSPAARQFAEVLADVASGRQVS